MGRCRPPGQRVRHSILEHGRLGSGVHVQGCRFEIAAEEVCRLSNELGSGGAGDRRDPVEAPRDQFLINRQVGRHPLEVGVRLKRVNARVVCRYRKSRQAAQAADRKTSSRVLKPFSSRNA
jgi:hypothetical protein